LSPLSTHRGQMRFVFAVAVVVFLALSAAGIALYLAAHQSRNARRDLCVAENGTRNAVAQILRLARSATRGDLDRRHAPADARFRAEQFYAEAIKAVHPLPCNHLAKG
jgi:hypothetical protein